MAYTNNLYDFMLDYEEPEEDDLYAFLENYEREEPSQEDLYADDEWDPAPAQGDQWRPEPEMVEPEPVQKEGSTLGAFGQTLSRVPENLAAKLIMAVQGQEGASVADKGIADRFVNWVEERNRKLSEEYKGTGDFIPGVISKQDVADLGPNLAFGGVSMGGTIGGGAVGGLAGAPGGPLAVGGAIAGGVAGGAAAAYRMDAYQAMNDWLKKANDESIAKGLGPISKEEEEKFKTEMSDLATEHGLWEAGPEGIGNVLELALMTAKNIPGVRWIPRNIAGKVAKAGLRAAGIVGAEATTETATQMGQHNVEVDAGMSQDPKREWTSGDDLLKSVKEVLPQVLLLSGVMGAGGAAYRKATQPAEVTPPPIDPEKEKILPTTKIDTLTAKANGVDVAAATGIITQHEPIAEKDTNTLNRLIEDDAKKAQARQLKEAADLMEAQRLEAVPINREQFVAALTDPNDETTINDYEQFGLKPEEITDIQKAAETPPEPIVEPEPIPEPTPIEDEFDIDTVLGQVKDGAMINIDVSDQDGNITTEQVDAKTALKEVNDRREVFNKILNCMAG